MIQLEGQVKPPQINAITWARKFTVKSCHAAGGRTMDTCLGTQGRSTRLPTSGLRGPPFGDERRFMSRPNPLVRKGQTRTPCQGEDHPTERRVSPSHEQE
jgi:hypothetical protein